MTTDLETLLSHMNADKVSIAPFGDFFIITTGTEEARKVEDTQIAYEAVNSEQFGQFFKVEKKAFNRVRHHRKETVHQQAGKKTHKV